MKKMFLAVVALAAMTACSNDEFVSVDRAPINFGEAFVDNATRATDTTYGAVPLESFNVYGTVKGKGVANPVNIFSGDEVTGTVGSNIVNGVETHVWNCDKEEYWVVGAAYNFAAVVDATVVEATKTAAGMPTQLAPKASGNGSNFQDMLYAAASVEEATANQGPVNFTFEHLLSKVQFTVTSTATGSYSHSVTGITVENYKTGAYTIAVNGDGEDVSYWAVDSGVDNKKNVEFEDITDVTATSTETVGSTTTPGLTNATQMLLIPTTEPFDVTFTVEVYRKNGENNKTLVSTETKTVTVTGKPLVKGNAYNFTIECKLNSPIKFSVTNNPTWDSTNGTVTVQ